MQGFNMGRYVPPELEGTASANQVSGKNALGHRARKAGQGILTVRFEMPFAIWCNTCPKPTIIGQGVRFNAEKKKVGAYYSSPIWAFRMKHVACRGWIEIRTDPKNTEYVVTEGGRRRDTGEDKVREGDLEIRTEEEKRRLQEDAFAALEVKIDDRQRVDADKVRIEELYAQRERDWEDPYRVNKRLRKGFRAERKDLERKAGATEKLKTRMSLGIELLEETEEDRKRAAVTDYGFSSQTGVESDVTGGLAASQPLFKTAKSKVQRKQAPDEMAKLTLQENLSQNTRANIDMFGTAKQDSDDPLVLGLKRKRTRPSKPGNTKGDAGQTAASSLVDYDSD